MPPLELRTGAALAVGGRGWNLKAEAVCSGLRIHAQAAVEAALERTCDWCVFRHTAGDDLGRRLKTTAAGLAPPPLRALPPGWHTSSLDAPRPSPEPAPNAPAV